MVVFQKAMAWLAIGLIGLSIVAGGAAGQEVLSSASEIAYPPFCLVDAQGRADGFAVELLRESLRLVGHEVSFRTGTWERVRGWLERGEVDVLPLVGRTPEREALFDFTFPYMTLSGALVVRQDTRGIAGLEDLPGRRVAVMRGDNAEEFLVREARDLEIVRVATFEQALQELSAGQHDAVVIQQLVALRLIRDLGLANLRIIPRPLTGFRQDFCFAVPKGAAGTLALLNEGLAEAKENGTFQRLHSQWFSSLELPRDRALLVGGDHDFPPFEYLNAAGHPEGFAVDLSRAIARQMGLDIEIRLGPWQDAVAALERGEIDILQGIFYSEDRSHHFDFTLPYAHHHYVVAGRSGSGSLPSSFADLEGFRVVVQDGDLIQEILHDSGFRGQVLRVETQAQALEALLVWRADYALVTRMSAIRILEERSLDLVLAQRPLYSAPYCMAVRKGNQALLTELNEGLRLLAEGGTFRRLQDHWLGVPHAPVLAWRVVARYLLWIGIPGLVVLLVALLWGWSLRRLVTERTASLRENEAKYRHLVENIQEIIFTVDAKGIFTFVSPAWTILLGHSVDEVIGRPFQPFVHPEDVSICEDTLHQIIRDGGSCDAVEYRVLRVDHTWRWHKCSLVPLRDVDGLIVGLEGIAEDVSERKQAILRIEHLNRVLRAVRDITALMVQERDRGRLIREACRLLVDHRGYASAVLLVTDAEGTRMVDRGVSGLAATMTSLQEGGSDAELPAGCRTARESATGIAVVDRGHADQVCPLLGARQDALPVCICLRHEGRVYGYLAVALALGDDLDVEERELLIEMGHDLGYALHNIETEAARQAAEVEREVLQDQLNQVQKLEAVGRLAGGVAHDFNNLLMGMMGYVELSVGELPGDHPVQEYLAEITRSAKRSADLTRQLLAFARRQPVAPQVLDLNATIASTLKLLQRLLGEDVEMIWKPGKRVACVKMDPTQMDQILANLCVNARDAMPDGGTLGISTDVVRIGALQAQQYPEGQPGTYAVLQVSDTGCGIAPDVQAHIFEPFFTTKALGKGTGLGLATLYGIVMQNQGFVMVESKEGTGTTFKVYFPMLDQPQVSDEDLVGDDPVVSAGAGETILLVEDDPSIRRVLVRQLEKAGYHVWAAGDPDTALRLVETEPGEIALLLSDVVLPGMTGREMAQRLTVLRPGLKTLFMSGYSPEITARHGVLQKGIAFLQKPVALDTLLAKIRSVLEENG